MIIDHGLDNVYKFLATDMFLLIFHLCTASPRFHDLDKFSGLPLNDC